MKNIFIMIGVPGSGKDWVINNNKLPISDGNLDIVSRDKIRFSLIKDNEDYFSKEKEVTAKFWAQINEDIMLGVDNIVINQTSISKGSRRKLFNHLLFNPLYKKIAVWVHTPLEVALKQNAMRTGRAKVPDDVIKNMYDGFNEPELDEGFDAIYTYTDDKMILLAAKR